MIDDDSHHLKSEMPIEARLAEPPPKFLDNKWAVIAILFAVTGFLGIPLLWTNKSFSSAERVFWSIVVCLYTLALLGGTVAVVMWSYRQVFGG